MTDHDDDDDFWVPLPKAEAAEFDSLRQMWRESVADLAMPEPGDIVKGRYEVVRRIGMGGFGCVFEVQHVDLGRRFALKLLTPHVAQRPGWKERFREEARTTSQIGHENIVFITDFGTCDAFGSYFVMEYLQGESLAEILERGPLTLEDTLHLLQSACAGLDAAHEREIVHCDLKPGNIFRSGTASRPHWKLLDFGTSSIVMSAVKTQTLYGTPKYMAPEHAMGQAVDRRADIFSMGVVAYEALTGKLPWDSTMWLQATPRWRTDHPPAPPSHIAPHIPPSWDPIILKALAVSPDERFARAGLLSAALVKAGEGPRLQVAGRAAAPTPLTPATVVGLNPGASFRSSLSPGEVFVMSRIEEGLTLGELNRMCTGLPFSIDDTVRSMVDRGYVVLQDGTAPPDARKPLRPRPTEPKPGPETSEPAQPLDVPRLLQRVDALRTQGNFLGAVEILRSAIVTWPDIATLHYRYAMLLREFGNPREQVIEALRRALALEPTNGVYRSALYETERLA